MNVVLGGLISEAWARSVASYSRSLEFYINRTADGIQPHTPYFDVFNVEQQNSFLCYANAVYLLVTVILFAYMKRRTSGFRLRWILVLYDGSNVLIASYIAISILRYKLTHGGLLVCNTLANDPEGYKISWVFALFYAQKYYEFLDTWFFILRKSSRQVTFLHLFHHSSITVVVGSILPFDYNADMYLPILLNSANHTLLYLHYLLATLGLKSWWAPYITSMQLLQFCVIFAQSLLSYRVGPACGSPDFAKVLMIVYMGSMIALFLNFFLQKYVLRRPVQALDMCGVVKRPQHLYSNVPSQYCGTAVLDSAGCCTVVLPDDFPDEQRILRESLRHPTPFCIVYSLTAMGCAMPSLHVAREVGRLVPPAPTAPARSPSSSGRESPTSLAGSGSSSRSSKHQHHQQQQQQVKFSPNSATALSASARDKRKKTTSRDVASSPPLLPGVKATAAAADCDSSDNPPAAREAWDNSNSSKGSRKQQWATEVSGTSLFPDSAAFVSDLPATNTHSSSSSSSNSSNVIKSASISDFRVLPSHSSLNLSSCSSRESSSGNLQQLLHNDRLIDGPLPLSESFKLINRYSQQFRSGISESIFRLTLGTLAAEERGGGGLRTSAGAAAADDDAAATAPAAGQGDEQQLQHKSNNTHPEDADESMGICGALSAADRAASFNYADSCSAVLNVYAVPLSFSIGGGVPGATVSWVVHTAPIVPGSHLDNSSGSSSSSGKGKDVVAGGVSGGAAGAAGVATCGTVVAGGCSPPGSASRRKGSAFVHHPQQYQQQQVGSTGIIRSSSSGAHLSGGGSIGANGGGFGSAGSLEDLGLGLSAGQKQHLLYAAEDQEDYALDWRAIS